MAHWQVRIWLSKQGIRVGSQVWEDSTHLRATKPMHHNYWACALEPAQPRIHRWQLGSLSTTPTEACAPRTYALQQKATGMRSPCPATKSNPCSLQLEKADAMKTQHGQIKKNTKNYCYSSGVQQDFLQWWKCSISALSNTIAPSHKWLLSA